EWSHAQHISPAMKDESNGNPSDNAAEFYFSYDSKALYFAVKAHGDPRHLVSDEFRPNTNLGSNDQVVLFLDPKGGTNMNRFALG
ncbi:hypothetical protein ABTM50_20560, partial [Acinetobacter baumannii]